jgi:hypothetical protein
MPNREVLLFDDVLSSPMLTDFADAVAVAGAGAVVVAELEVVTSAG